MSSSFRFVALPCEQFDSLRYKSDVELGAMNIHRMVVTEKPGFPCRVSLADAEVGETVLLLPFTHHEAPSPFRSSGPIFVKPGAKTAHPQVGEIPPMFHSRLLSIRAYDEKAIMIAAEVVKGVELKECICRLFDNPDVRYLHIHNAKPGCYNCRVDRA